MNHHGIARPHRHPLGRLARLALEACGLQLKLIVARGEPDIVVAVGVAVDDLITDGDGNPRCRRASAKVNDVPVRRPGITAVGFRPVSGSKVGRSVGRGEGSVAWAEAVIGAGIMVRPPTRAMMPQTIRTKLAICLRIGRSF